MQNALLPGVISQFEYYKQLGEKTMAQLSDEELIWSPDTDVNSIAVIVKHLWGNMMSRWTDFLDSDGEKDWRDREAEFDNDLNSREEIMEKWEEGWEALFTAIRPLSDTDLRRLVYIRNQGHMVGEAIFRQLAHYAYHIGQMVYLAKYLKRSDWKSLSIPRGQSEAFNKRHFEQERHREHFTKEFLDDENE